MRRLLSLWLLPLLLVAFKASSVAAAKPNVVLITLDSTRADRMGFLGSHGKLTPNLDALARDSVVFERAYAQAPLTVVSHATILSGTYPQTHKVTEFAAPLAGSLPYLPDLLHGKGYHTAAFVGAMALDPKNGGAPGFDRGFDVYDAGFHLPQKGEGRYQSVARRGDQVVARALAWMAANSRGPFFLWVHLNDAHAPYGASYDAGVRATDAAVGKLVAALRAQKLYDDTVITVAADHGESLGAHGEDTHGVFLYDETIHVPLVVKLPHQQMAGKQVPARVRLVDVAPTMLEAAEVPVPSQMQGQSLLRVARSNPNADQPVYVRSDFPQRAFGWSGLQAWMAGKYLYVRAPKPELYDLTADPGATHSLAQTSKATLDTIAGQLEAFDSRFSQGGKTAGPELSSSEMQKLASLGYVGLQKSAGTSTAASGTDPKDEIKTANKIQNAMLDLEAGQVEKVIAALQPIVAKQPDMYLAQYALGVALNQQQRYPQAIERLHKAIELQPDSSWAHYYMGVSLLKTGDFKTATVHLEIAAGRLTECVAAHAGLAEAYEHTGRVDDAKRERAKAGTPGKGSKS
ncbi:MAG: sulfatase-like hydrolase/transferase [Acidobacteriia bacterium]|nr:sulfatase-like hydrolase/transferase [Terriglobia bacterium]